MAPMINQNPTFSTLVQLFSVKAQVPAALRVEEVRPELDSHNLISNFPYDVFIADGKTQYIMAKHSMAYISKPSAPELKDIDDTQGLLILLGLDTLLNPDLLEFQQIPNELLNNRWVHVYVRTQADQERSFQQSFRIDTATQLPKQFSEFYLDETSHAQEMVRVDYQDWKLNVTFDEATFDTTIPTGAHQLVLE